jgi:tetratricopeptide (TPR) repeat protein
LLSHSGRRDEALEAWRGALQVAPTHQPSIQALVGELQRRGDSAAALEVWEQAIAFDPDFMEGYRQIALLLLNSGQGLQAEDVLRRAVTRNPDYAPAWHGLGTIVYSSGRHEEGEGYLRRALRAQTSADTLAELARVLSTKSDEASQSQAARMLEQALAIDPNHARARELAREMGVPTH